LTRGAASVLFSILRAAAADYASGSEHRAA
jgi:hypothetical protein